MVSQYIKDSKLVNEQFDCDFVNLSTSRRMDEIGKGGAKKLLRFVGSYVKLFWKLMTRRYDLCYLAITCHGMGFLKDAPFVLLCKLFRRKVLIHQHNKGMSGCVDRWPYRWLLPLVYRNAKVMLLSWHLYDDISKVVKREQVVICANGIPEVDAVGGLNAAGRQVNRDESLVKSCEAAVNVAEPRLEDNSYTLDTTQNDNDDEKTAALYENDNENDDGSAITKTTSGAFAEGSQFAAQGSPLTANSQQSTANSQQQKVRLLFLSNLIESKGIYVLLDACKVLKERGLDFVCDFVGGESKAVSAETFREAIAERGLADCVAYHGPQYGDDKVKFLAQADIFVFPTYYNNECSPLVLMEAMQYGLPLVSTNEGGIPDLIVNGENGFVCERQDVPSLVVALETLIKDGALRIQMGEQGHARYKELYTLKAFEERFVAEVKRSGAEG